MGGDYEIFIFEFCRFNIQQNHKMKQNKLNLLITLMVISILSSCNKDDQQENSQSINDQLSLEGKQLVFNSVESYESLLDGGKLSSDVLGANLGYSNFESFGKKLLNNGLDADYKRLVYGFDAEVDSPIFNILNSEEMVTIGDWVIMVDMAKEIVGVTNSNNPALVRSIKAKDYSNSEIFWFNTSDDVLLLLEEGSKGTLDQNNMSLKLAKAKQKKELALSEINKTLGDCLSEGLDSSTNLLKDKKVFKSEANCVTPDECKKWIADAKHVYQKAGIYFSLQSKIKYRGNVPCVSNSPYAINTDLTIDVSYYYERRRRFRSNEKKSGTDDRKVYDNELNSRSYEGSRSLKHYRLNSTFTYRRKDNCASFGCNVPDPVVKIVLPQIAD